MSLLNLFTGNGDENSGAPTRAHWVPDQKVTFCQIVGCGKPFNFIDRRHHCRRCGEAVCRSHFGAMMRLSQDAVPDENGQEYKVCDDCFLTYQRRKLKIAGEGEFSEQSYFEIPQSQENLEIPAIVQAGTTQVFLLSVVSHVREVLNYFNTVRKTLKHCNDTTLKREYLRSENEVFDQMLNSLLDHENSLRGTLPTIYSQELSSYLQQCLIQIETVKEWIASTEVYMLRTGKTGYLRKIGMLPEEDFAVIEERIRANERLAESLMGRLFDVPREEQEKLLQNLQWVRARMDHDYREYLLIPGSEMESFIQRLEKSLEYIDLHVEMCKGSMQYGEMEGTVKKYEEKLSELAFMLEGQDEIQPDEANKIKEKSVELMRDVAIFKGLFEKTSKQSKGQRVDTTAQAISNRIQELESALQALEERLNSRLIQPTGLPRENFHGKAAELYQSLQVQRAKNINSAIESEMFDL